MLDLQEDSSKKEQPKVPLWKNVNYLFLWSGQSLSAVGNSVSTLSFPLIVLYLTKSPSQLGLISAVSALPYILLSLFAGALVDRWNRKMVMILCDAGRALNIISIPIALWLGDLTVVQLYIMSLCEGVFFVFFNLAATASLPSLVSKEQVSSATAIYQASDNIASFVGSPLGSPSFRGIDELSGRKKREEERQGVVLRWT